MQSCKLLNFELAIMERNPFRSCFSSNWIFFSVLMDISKNQWRSTGGIGNHIKNNAWNIRHLVNESFVPANQWTKVLYCRLSDFRMKSFLRSISFPAPIAFRNLLNPFCVTAHKKTSCFVRIRNDWHPLHLLWDSD